MVNFPSDGAESINASLLALRFPRKTNCDGVLPDYFIKLWSDLAYFSNNMQTKGRIRRAGKYIAGFLKELEQCDAPDNQKLAQLTESACAYLRCCKTDRSFSADFFGAVQLQQSKVDLKLANHVYGIGVTLMQQTGMEQEAALLCQALTDALQHELPHVLPLYEAIASKT